MKVKMYPLALRLWHWTNALLFLTLIITGVSMHYSGSGALLMPFDYAVKLHNIAGVSTSVLYLFFFMYNIFSGNYKQYIPSLNSIITNLIIQIRFYISGIFKNMPHPFDSTLKNKFNPLQKVTYLSIMYLLSPVAITTGLMMLYPESFQNGVFSFIGLTPAAILHASAGFFLSVFMIGHIYLATTGERITSNFKAMATGWHDENAHAANRTMIENNINI